VTSAPKQIQVGGFGAQGEEGPGLRVRLLISRDKLALSGVTVVPLPLFAAGEYARFAHAGSARKAAILAASHRRLLSTIAATPIDVAFIQRQVDLLPSLRAERAAASDRRLVLDVDDAIWFDFRATGAHPLALLKGTRRKLAWLARRADHVVAGNELLAEHLSRLSQTVTVIPSVVDLEAVQVRHHAERARHVVGWIGSPSTAQFVQQLAEPLERLAQELAPTELTLRMVGGSIRPPRGVELIATSWSAEAETALLAEIDVGLMPLPDDPWTRGKCAYKALQYMSAGIPVAADDVGITATVVGDGVAGRVLRERSEWPGALATLLRDPDLRNEMGAMGRQRVRDGFSLGRWAPTLAAVLRGDSEAVPPAARPDDRA
jgi:glycosyltransferase involved in cell wall biosynthesis